MSQQPPDHAEHDDDEEVRFERMARDAAASLHRPPPHEGAASIVGLARRHRARQMVGGVLAVTAVGVGVVVVSSRDDHSRSIAGTGTTEVAVNPTSTTAPATTAPPSSTPTTTVPPPSTAVVNATITADARVWLAAFVGAADTAPAGAPIRFGLFRPTTDRLETATITADYVNQHLGGVAGRPLEFAICTTSEHECADQFVADESVLAIVQLGDVAYSTQIAGRKPLIAPVSGGDADVSYFPSVIEDLVAEAYLGARLVAGDPTPKVAVDVGIATDHLPFIESTLRSVVPGVEVVNTRFTTPERIQADGAADADVFIHDIEEVGLPGCTQLHDAITTLAITPEVIVDGCPASDGWYTAGLARGLTDTGPTPAAASISSLLDAGGYRPPNDYLQTSGVQASALLLTLTKLVNELGPTVTPQQLLDAARSVTDDVPLTGGPLECGIDVIDATRVRGTCVRYVDVYQARDGQWAAAGSIDLSNGQATNPE